MLLLAQLLKDFFLDNLRFNFDGKQLKKKRHSRGLDYERLEDRIALTTYNWLPTAAGSNLDWTLASNWSPNTGYPHLAGDIANLTSALTGNETISLNSSSIALATLNLGAASGSSTYTINAGSLSVSSSIVKINGGSDTIAAPLNLAGAMALNDTSSAGLTISGVISGANSLTKTGSGIDTLSGINNYSGATIISSGTLKLGSSSALGSTSGVTISSGATLDLNGQAVGAITTNLSGIGVGGLGALINNSAASASLLGNIITSLGTYSVGGTGPITLSGTVTNATLTKLGTGTLTLSGSADNSSLSVTANNGTVIFAKASSSTVHAHGGTLTINNNATVQLAGTGGDQIYDGNTVVVNTGGSLDLNGQSDVIASLSLNGTGGVNGALINSNTSTASTLTVINGITLASATTLGGAGSMTLSGTITGAFALTKAGAGTVTLASATNSYSGGTTINAGTLATTALSGSPFGSGTITTSGGTLSVPGASSATTVQTTVPVSGYNADLIWGDSETSAATGTNAKFDDSNYAFYEAGVPGAPANTGLPHGGNFTSATNAAVTFQLGPYSNGSSTANNTLYLTTATTSATLTLNNPGSFQKLNLLDSASQGSANFTMQLNFATGTPTVISTSAQDWFNGVNAAILGINRVAGTTFDSPSNNPRLYESDFTLNTADQARLLQSITFTLTSGTHLGIFALSGTKYTTAYSLANNVSVINTSTVAVQGFPGATFGNLSLANNATLNVSGQSGGTAGNANVTFGAISFANSTVNIGLNTSLFLGALSDNGAVATLTQTGAGYLYLYAAAQSIVNGTAFNFNAVNSGQTIIYNSTALGTLANVYVGDYLFLSTDETFGSLNGSGYVGVLLSTTLTIGSTNNLSGSYTGTIDALTSGVNLIKVGTGSETLSGSIKASTFQILTGIVNFQGLGNLVFGCDVTVSNGTTMNLQLGSGVQALSINSLSGGGIVNLGSNQLIVNGTNSTTFSGTITGTGSISKMGSGTQTFSGNNTYTGSTQIGAGTLIAANNTALGNNSAVSVAFGATLTVQAPTNSGLLGQYYNLTPNLVGSSDPDFSSLDALSTSLAGQQAALTSLSSTTNSTSDFHTDGSAFPAPYNHATNFEAFYSGQFNAQTTGSYTFATNSDDGSVLFIDGNMVVNNNFTQLLTSRSGSIFLAAGLHHIVIGYFQTTGGEGFQVGVQRPSDSGIFLIDNSLLSTSFLQLGSLSGSGTVTLTGTSQLFVGGNNTNSTFSGVLSGTTDRGLVKLGSGTFTLSGTNTYGGTTTIDDGALQFGDGITPASNQIIDDSVLTLANTNNLNIANVITGTGTANLTSYVGAVSQSTPLLVPMVNAFAATGINLSNAANTINNLTASNAATGAITVVTTSAITVNNVNQAVDGDISIQSIGTNTAMTIVGSVTSATGKISLQAKGSLSLSPGQIVSSTFGSITLGADLNASGNGDDGIGTLSLGAGSSVLSANTTLRGADQEIDPTAIVKSDYPSGVTQRVFASGFNGPNSLAVDSTGYLYVSNFNTGVIQKIDYYGNTTIFASGFIGPTGLTFDTNGNLYVAAVGDNNVYKVTPDGAVSSYATGFNQPMSMVFDAQGNMYVVNGGNSTISKVASGSHAVTAYVTSGLNGAWGIAIDNTGQLYVANYFANSIIKVTTGAAPTMTTFATGLSNPSLLSFDHTGNLAVSNIANNTVSTISPSGLVQQYASGFNSPHGLVFDATGDLYVVNSNSGTISQVTPPIIPIGISTFVSGLGLNSPNGEVFDAAGNLYLADGVLKKITPTGTISTFASNLNGPNGLTIDTTGNIYVASTGNNTIYKVTSAGMVSTYATGFNQPQSMVFDTSGNLYVVNGGDFTISKVTPAGIVSSYVTNGLNGPWGITIDSSNNLYVCNYSSNSISKIASGSTTASIFATGIIRPTFITIDNAGNLYVSCNADQTIDKITPSGNVSTYSAGINFAHGLAFDSSGYLYVANGESGSITKITPPGQPTFKPLPVTFSGPAGQAYDSSGNLYIADYIANTITKITPSGTSSVVVDASKGLNFPNQIAFDASGNLYVANQGTGSISKITFSSPGIFSSITNNFVTGFVNLSGLAMDQAGNLYVGNNHSIAKITFTSPGVLGPVNMSFATGFQLIYDLCTDQTGNVYAADFKAGTVIRVTPSGSISTIIPGVQKPNCPLVDSSGNVYVSTGSGNTIYKWTATGGLTTFATNLGGAFELYFDPSGNLLVSDFNHGIVEQYKYAAPLTTSVLIPSIPLNSPEGVTVDSAGNIYIANTNNDTIVKETPTGNMSLYSKLPSGSHAAGLAIDPIGNLYVANYLANSISLITPLGIQQTLVNTGLSNPVGLTFDSAGNLYVSNSGSGNIIKYTFSSPGLINSTVTVATGMTSPLGICADLLGNLYVASSGAGGGITQIAPTGARTQLVTNQPAYYVTFGNDGSLYYSTYFTNDYIYKYANGTSSVYSTAIVNPAGLEFDASGNLYVTDHFSVYKVTPNSVTALNLNKNFSALNYSQMIYDAAGNLYIANYNSNEVYKITPAGVKSVFVDSSHGLHGPIGLAFDRNGNLYVSNSDNTVRKITPTGTTTIPINGGLNNPQELAFDAAGNLFVANYNTSTISMMTRFGVLTTFANSTNGIQFPRGLTFDSAGNLYVANGTGTIVKITFSSPGVFGAATTIATGFSSLAGLTFDPSGNLFLADIGTESIDEISAQGIVSTYYPNNGSSTYYGLTIDASGSIYANDLTSLDIIKLSPPRSGQISIRASLPTLQMSIGGANNAVTGINLTDMELSRLSTNSGILQIGDSSQTGAIKLSTVTSTASITTLQQSNSGGGQIIIDNGGGSGHALNGNGGTINLNAGLGGILEANSNTNAVVDFGNANSLNLVSAGPIGTSALPIQISATNLATDSTTNNNGQYLSIAGILTATSLSAGSGTVTLQGTGNITFFTPNTLSVTSSLTVSGVTLNLGANNQTVAGLTLSSNGIITGTTGILTSSSTVLLQSGTISANLFGTSGLTKTSAGLAVLSGINNLNGTTTITNGILRLGSPIAISNSSGDLIFNPSSNTATLDLNGFSVAFNSLSSTGAGSSVIDNTSTTSQPILSVGSNNASGNFTGTIQNTGLPLSLAKFGSGTQTLSGNSTYSGITAINAGTLLVDGSLFGTTVTVNSTLGGTGTVDGSVLVNGGTISPGDPTSNKGILTLRSADFSQGGTLILQVAGNSGPGTNYDQLNLLGSLTLGGTSKITLDYAGLSTNKVVNSLIKYTSKSGVFTTTSVINNPSNLPLSFGYNSTSLDLNPIGITTKYVVSVLTPAPPEIAGNAFIVTVTAEDANNNVTVGYSGTVHFTSNDPQAALPANATLTNGTGIFLVTLKTAGASETVTATDTVNSSITGQTAVQVNGTTTKFLVSTSSSSTIAGTPVLVSVQAEDSNNNPTNFTGTATLAASLDGSQAFALGTTLNLSNGVGYTIADLTKAGSQTISASSGTITGNTSVTVSAAAPSYSNIVTTGTSQSATVNTAFTNLSITVNDAYGNPVVSVPVTFTAPSSGASGKFSNSTNTITASTNSSGVLIEAFTGNTAAGSYTVTASLSGVTPAFNYSLTNLTGIAANVTVTSGSGQSATVSTNFGAPLVATVTDQYGNPVSGVTVTFADPTTGASGTFGANPLSTNANGQVSETLRANATAGAYSVTATSAGVSTPASFSETNTSATVSSSVTHFVITTTLNTNPGQGVPYSFTVTAEDVHNNAVTNYAGTIQFTSFPSSGITFSGAGLVGGNQYTFLSSDQGTHTFSVTSSHTGSQSITVTDISPPSSGTTGISSSANFTVLNFFVSSITPTATGFIASFNTAFNPNVLALYGTTSTTVASVTLVGASSGKIPGSLIINPTNTSVQFKATSSFLLNLTSGAGLAEPILPDDNYTLTLISGVNGFSTAGNVPLDGLSNGGSANFTSTFTTSNQSNATTILGIPDFARGPDNSKPVKVPNNGGSGIPITIYNDPTGSMTDVTFTLHYNPILLTITGTNIGDASSPTSVFTLVSNNTVTGIASFSYHNVNPQNSTLNGVVLGDIVATIPTTTAAGIVYGSKELLTFDDSLTTVNGTPGALSQPGIHVDAYLGDVTGNGTVDGTDAVTAKAVANGTATGFAHFKLLDPSIVGDVAGSGNVDSSSVTTITRFAANLAVPQIPKPPAGVVVTQVGADPMLSLPQTLSTNNGIVNVPVLLDHSTPQGSTGLNEAILGIAYDPNVLTITPADITLGSIPTSAIGWQLQANVDAKTGQVGITLFSPEPITIDQAGSLVNLQFHVQPGVIISNSSVQLVASTTPNGFYYPTQLDDTQSMYELNPTPTNIPGAVGFTSLLTMPISTASSPVDPIESELTSTALSTESHPIAAVTHTTLSASETDTVVATINALIVNQAWQFELQNWSGLYFVKPEPSNVMQILARIGEDSLLLKSQNLPRAISNEEYWELEPISLYGQESGMQSTPSTMEANPESARQTSDDAAAMDLYFALLVNET